jgi:hypothetical protein
MPIYLSVHMCTQCASLFSYAGGAQVAAGPNRAFPPVPWNWHTLLVIMALWAVTFRILSGRVAMALESCFDVDSCELSAVGAHPLLVSHVLATLVR